MIDSIVQGIRNELISQSDEQNRLSAHRFFKETVKLHGVKSAQVRAISAHYFTKHVKKLNKNEVLALCEKLWESKYLEETFVSCYFSERFVKKLTPDDFLILEKWVKSYIDNWASCDTFCNHTVGDMLILYPQLIDFVKPWTQSENRWVRRAAAVSFIVPARKGLFHNHIIEIARLLLTDSDDMIQKGYGWMLKAASQSNQNLIFNFVMDNKSLMPRTALRYAIEKMPPEVKSLAMSKA